VLATRCTFEVQVHASAILTTVGDSLLLLVNRTLGEPLNNTGHSCEEKSCKLPTGNRTSVIQFVVRYIIHFALD
jgi:hypothetical protein